MPTPILGGCRLLAFLAHSLVSAQQWSRPQQGPPGSAAYFLDNSPSGSSLVSLKIGSDHLLSDPVRTSTGGSGSIALNAASGQPVAADSLQSQDSVVVSGNLLFTMNAGSATLAMFRINPWDPYRPVMIGKPVSTSGDFPVSVAYSDAIRTACVLDGGATAGVSCFSVDYNKGLTASGSLRPFPKNIFSQTTPPAGPPLTASELIFSPDNSALFAILKGSPATTPVTPGHIVSYAVDNGQVSDTGVDNAFTDLPLAFGAVFINTTSLFIGDPSFGAAILDTSNPAQITIAVSTKEPTQKAICWVQYDASLQSAYAIDAAQPVVYVLDSVTGAADGEIRGSSSLRGFFDMSILDGYMYGLTAVNGLVVIDLSTQQEVQFLNLSAFGSHQGYDGFAVWSPGNAKWTGGW